MKKKLLALLLSSAMVMSLAACGGGGAASSGTPAASKPANSGAPAAPEANALQVTLVVADTFGDRSFYDSSKEGRGQGRLRQDHRVQRREPHPPDAQRRRRL